MFVFCFSSHFFLFLQRIIFQTRDKNKREKISLLFLDKSQKVSAKIMIKHIIIF